MFGVQQWNLGLVVGLNGDSLAQSEKRSHAQVVARASLLICAYLILVFVVDLETYATVCHSLLSVFWSSTAPRL